VYAFDELVACYMLHAKRISLENRAALVGLRGDADDNDKISGLFLRRDKICDRGRRARARVKDYLQQARRDIILSRGEPGGLADGNEEGEALGTMAFDTTSLARALSVSVLYGTFSAPLPRRRAKGPAAAGGGGGGGGAAAVVVVACSAVGAGVASDGGAVGAGVGGVEVEGGAEVGVDGAYGGEEAAQVGESVRGGVGVACFWGAGGEGGVDDEGCEEGDLGGWWD
jgi:hypothetical protein